MALIAMAVYDTEENQRTSLTQDTIYNLLQFVNLSKHRLIIVDNNSCEATKEVYKKMYKHWNYFPDETNIEVIYNESNLGTAEAINLAWKKRLPNENCIKMDNDIKIWSYVWVDKLEEAIARDPKIGQAGLKRKDCWENPNNEDPFYKSQLYFLPHKAGEAWIPVEEVNHVMGTCVMHSAALLDKIGYLYQPKLYGFDDSLMSLRSKMAGFKNVFLPYIDIDHIDTKEITPYQTWKQDYASQQWQEYHQIIAEYKSGKRSIYYNPFN